MYTNRLYFILAAALVLSSCASGRLTNDVFEMKEIHDFERAPLFGIVYNSKNKPCSGADISLYDPDTDKEVHKVVSDINGRFMIPELKKGVHNVAVRKSGFEEGTISFDFADATQVLYIQMISLESLLESAEGHLDKRNLKDADSDLERAFKIDPASLETLYLQAVLYKLRGDDAESLEKLEAIRQLDPDF